MKPKPFEIIVEFIPQCTKTAITYETYQKGLLIRCKDCKYWRTNDDLHRCFVWCVYTVGDGFCYRAERKDDGETD